MSLLQPIIFRVAGARTVRGRRVNASYYIESEDKPFSCSYPPVYREGKREFGLRNLEVVPGRYERDALSFAVGGSGGYRTRLTKDAVDRQLRHVRQEELDAIAAIDAELALLKVRRREAVERAWQKGHVVTVSELAQRATARLQAVEATRRELREERRREAGAARVED